MSIPARRSQAESLYFGWIAMLPCIVSGARPVQVAHIRGADAWFDKELPGTARKPSIPYVVPLAHERHLEQEAGNWRFWESHGMPREPAQDSVLFHCWWLWRIYQCDLQTSHRSAELYLTKMRELRQSERI